MFLGTYQPKLDEKGRLILPAKFREALAEGLVVTKTQDRALAVYPRATFEAKMTSLLSAPSTVKEVRDYQRMLMAGASDEIPDRQGRVTIPANLRSYAGLDRDVVVIGAGDRAEIWDAAAWEKYSESSEEGFSEMDNEFTALAGL
ncbi:MraZ protein [Tessaracoccus bendigoensis DSM 12906]|uniref:Transcriptional regulator MraZ n=1 Tax=Tessaracoccus bendigoensis DSM 12906 TaxID=1123357 RepID=A0A1M6AQT3_9ACTN|nr:division/cell wall cluster transcriptional repressor MraZ [Tessaracoccus bendigoensis]SHI38836.1 MraZ protein [Tessaracoccus bendigoensis DSM 12906]